MGRASIEEQIENLERIGITFNDKFDLDVIFEDFERDELESQPYDYLILSVANNEFCDSVANFGMGAIEPQGQSHADIFLKLDSMTGGSLGITEVKDNFDDLYSSSTDGLREAWVELNCRGENIHYDFLYDFEYLDQNVFFRFNELLKKHKIGYQIYNVPQDEHGIYVALQEGQFNKLEELVTDFEVEKITYREEMPWIVDEINEDITPSSFSKNKIYLAIVVVSLILYFLLW